MLAIAERKRWRGNSTALRNAHPVSLHQMFRQFPTIHQSGLGGLASNLQTPHEQQVIRLHEFALLRPEDVARSLQISRTRVYDLIRGRIPNRQGWQLAELHRQQLG